MSEDRTDPTGHEPTTDGTDTTDTTTTDDTTTTTHDTMTDNTDTTDTMTDTTDTTSRGKAQTDDRTGHTDDQQSVPFPPECRQTMKDMDHSSPVEGANRTFERKNEGKPDGGRRDGKTAEPATDGTDQDDAKTDGGHKPQRRTMKDMDHTPPVSGANRTFDRKNEREQDVAK